MGFTLGVMGDVQWLIRVKDGEDLWKSSGPGGIVDVVTTWKGAPGELNCQVGKQKSKNLG